MVTQGTIDKLREHLPPTEASMDAMLPVLEAAIKHVREGRLLKLTVLLDWHDGTSSYKAALQERPPDTSSNLLRPS